MRNLRSFLASIILTTALLCGCIAIDTSLQEIPPGDFSFDSINGTITSYTGPGGEVIIPAQIGNISIKHIGESVFNGRDDIYSNFQAK